MLDFEVVGSAIFVHITLLSVIFVVKRFSVHLTKKLIPNPNLLIEEYILHEY